MIEQKKVSQIKKRSLLSRIGKDLKDNWQFLVMVLPQWVHSLLFCYLPMLGIIVAFKKIDYAKGIFFSPWCGLDNFKFLFQNPDVGIVLRNTLLYNIAFLIQGMVFPVIFSILISMLLNKRLSKLYQTIMMLPYFLSWIIVSYVVYSFFAYNLGLMNTSILPMLGFTEPIDWYAENGVWPIFLFLLNGWKYIGYNSVVYLASIAGIDATLYEAAAIDGANKRQMMWHITLPCITNVLVITTILQIGRILNSDFSMFYNVPKDSGALFPTTNVISTFVYRALRVNGDVGMSSAASMLLSVVGFILVMITNGIVRKIDEDKALF